MSPGITLLIFGLSYYAVQSNAVPVEYSTSGANILLQISSGNNSCKNASFFSDLNWEEVAVFDSLCNIKAPSIQEAPVLLNYNVVPVLCMGFYEASLMLCKSSINSSLNEGFPATHGKMNNMIEKITKQHDFVSLTKFCKITVENFTKDENSVEAPWHSILREEFKDESKCSHICGTIESDKVHPLCSFIVWSTNVTSQTSLHMQKHGEIMPNAGDVNNIDAPSAPAVTEQKIPATTPSAPKSDSENQGGAANTGDGENELPPVNPETAAQMPPNLSDNTADRPSKSGDVSRGPSQVTDHKKTDSDLTTKTELSISTDFQVEEKVNTDVDDKKKKLSSIEHNEKENLNPIGNNKEVKFNPGVDKNEDKLNPDANKDASTKESTADQPLPEVNSNDDIPQIDGDIEAPVEEKNRPVGELDPEEGVADDIDIINQKKEDKEEVNGLAGGHLAAEAASNKQKEPADTNAELAGDAGRVVMTANFIEPEDPHFFFYFLFMSVLTILAYLAFHNKNKLLALAVEGRRTKGTRRRPNSSNYSKLHCSLEEAMSSKSTASVTHVLY